MNKRNYEEALEAFNKAIELDESAPAPYINLADLFLELGDLDSAYSIIKKVPDELEIHPGILSKRGEIEIQLQNYISAIRSFDEAIKNDLGNFEYLAWKAYAKYLHLEVTSKPGDIYYNHNIMTILRTLEKACNLIKTVESKEKINPWLLTPQKKVKQNKYIFRVATTIF